MTKYKTRKNIKLSQKKSKSGRKRGGRRKKKKDDGPGITVNL